jgi:hypothetical protein
VKGTVQYGKGEPLGFGRPAEPRPPVDAESFMEALWAFVVKQDEKNVKRLAAQVEAIFSRLDG